MSSFKIPFKVTMIFILKVDDNFVLFFNPDLPFQIFLSLMKANSIGFARN